MTTKIQKSAKDIVKGLNFLTPEMQNIILTNRVSKLPIGLETTATDYKFVMVNDFAEIEQIQIPKSDVRLWEIFAEFANTKTAIQCMAALSEGRKLTHKFFETQKNVTPKKALKATTFTEFYNEITPEEKQNIKTAITAWDKSQLQDGLIPYFEHHRKNTDGLKTGDYVVVQDNMQNNCFYGRVFQAEDNGMIFIISELDFFQLPNYMNARKAEAEIVEKKIKEKIDKIFNRYAETGDELRNIFFERLEKAEIKKAEKDKKAAEKAEKSFEATIVKAIKMGLISVIAEGKDKGKYVMGESRFTSKTLLKNHLETEENLKAMMDEYSKSMDEKQNTEKAEILALPAATKEDIEAIVLRFNQFENWSGENKKTISAHIKKARESQKAAQKPAAAAPKAADQPAADQQPARKPKAEKPKAEKPAAEKPAAEKPAAEKPAAAAQKPKASQPTK